jgi:hypothetical protein
MPGGRGHLDPVVNAAAGNPDDLVGITKNRDILPPQPGYAGIQQKFSHLFFMSQTQRLLTFSNDRF